MKIYRIQNHNGDGPFQGKPHDWKDYHDYKKFMDLTMSYYDIDMHPDIHRDFPDFKKNGLPYCYYCGCITLEKLALWFTHKMLDILSNNNFKLCIFDVKNNYVQIGKYNTQCIFDIYEGKMIQQLSVLNLKKIVDGVS